MVFSKLISLNSFSETNILLSIIFSSNVIMMFVYDAILLLKIFLYKIYHHLSKRMSLISQNFLKQHHLAIHHPFQSKS